MLEPEDPYCYVRVVLNQVWQDVNHSGVERARASDTCHRVNSITRLAKLIMTETGIVYASAEASFPDIKATKAIIPLLLTCLKLAGQRFDEALFAQEKEAQHSLELVRWPLRVRYRFTP